MKYIFYFEQKEIVGKWGNWTRRSYCCCHPLKKYQLFRLISFCKKSKKREGKTKTKLKKQRSILRNCSKKNSGFKYSEEEKKQQSKLEKMKWKFVTVFKLKVKLKKQKKVKTGKKFVCTPKMYWL